jgi:hypothetical protein
MLLVMQIMMIACRKKGVCQCSYLASILKTTPSWVVLEGPSFILDRAWTTAISAVGAVPSGSTAIRESNHNICQ